jgi:hypothetical protein
MAGLPEMEAKRVGIAQRQILPDQNIFMEESKMQIFF